MVSEAIRIALAQVNFTVGALQHNLEKVKASVQAAEDADLVVFP